MFNICIKNYKVIFNLYYYFIYIFIIMIEPLLISSSVLLGKEFVNQTITKTTNNIYGNIDAIIIDSSFEFKNLLDDLDITTKLDIINSFICNLKEDNNIYSKTILKTLDYLIDIFKKIEKELDNIKLEIIEDATTSL